jgi:hypothetical protein
VTTSVVLSLLEGMVVLVFFAFALAVTLTFEMPVAALFRVGNRGFLAVLLVNVATNLVVVLIAYLVVLSGSAQTWVRWAVAALVEAAVVIIEWRLLLWALGDTVGSSRRLFALSLTMNVASILGPYLLGLTRM